MAYFANSFKVTDAYISKTVIFFTKNSLHYSRETSYLLGGGLDNIRVTRISDGEHRHAMKLTTSGTKVNIVTGVVMDTSLGKHGVVLNFRLAYGGAVVRDDHQLCLEKI